MKTKLALVLVIVAIFLGISRTAVAGVNATNCYFNPVRITSIDGTNAVEMTAYYPESWSNRTLEVSTDITSNYWRGVMLSEQVRPRVSSPAGELPKWTKWFVNTDLIIIGSRHFRMKVIPPDLPPPQ